MKGSQTLSKEILNGTHVRRVYPDETFYDVTGALVAFEAYDFADLTREVFPESADVEGATCLLARSSARQLLSV